MKEKVTNIFNKIRPQFLKNKISFKKPKINLNSKIEYEKTEFKEELRKYLGHMETKSFNMDYQQIMNYIYTQDKIDMEEAQKKHVDSEREKIEKDIEKKISKNDQIFKSNFFNQHSLKILENTDRKNLVNLACKSYVGDTDIPHDPERSFVILKLAKLKCEKEEEIKETQFFLDYFRKNSAKDQKEINESCQNIFKDTGYIKSKYVTARDLFKIITYNAHNLDQENMTAEEKDFIYGKIYDTMEQAANEGIYEAYYILGIMNLNGYYVKKNEKKAFFYFTVAGSYSHSLSYYELFKMLRDNVVTVYSIEEEKIKKSAMFDYLKLAAEEGYVEAMHELGNQYMKGELVRRSNLKALAWHRQACRNGYLLSYEPCGDLFYSGGDGVTKNKSLSIVMYYCAYMKGIMELKDKILKIREELHLEGDPVPEMILI